MYLKEKRKGGGGERGRDDRKFPASQKLAVGEVVREEKKRKKEKGGNNDKSGRVTYVRQDAQPRRPGKRKRGKRKEGGKATAIPDYAFPP